MDIPIPKAAALVMRDGGRRRFFSESLPDSQGIQENRARSRRILKPWRITRSSPQVREGFDGSSDIQA